MPANGLGRDVEMTTKDLRFLVADDFEPMRKTVKSCLAEMGFTNVAVASNGREAINELDAKPVDFIISDWNMPAKTGFELLTYARSTEAHKNIPFIMVTAEGERAKVLAAITAGVSDIVIKPFRLSYLKEKINKQLNLKKGRRVQAPVNSGSDDFPTVLVVDDHPANIDVVTEVLKSSYKIKAATSGTMALKILKANPEIDLILLDIVMPDMDGYEVCRQLKDDSETAEVPVIFLTSKSDDEYVVKGFDLGAVDYITKPIVPEILAARVKTHVRLKQSRDHLRSEIDTAIANMRLRDDVERITRHDLKNPLSVIIHSNTHLIENRYVPEDLKKEAQQALDSAYNILGMINRSLDLYKMETGAYKLKPEKVDMVHLVNKLVEDFRVSGAEKQLDIQFQSSGSCLVKGEELLCIPLLGNLFKNAIEASPNKGSIKVSVVREKQAIVKIQNQGVIPKEIRDQFFDKYITANKEGGTGLGTYSAMLMAKTQGGNITFETSESSGTCLSVALPLAV